MKKGITYLFLMLLFASVVRVHAQKKPNLVYILADDLGYGDLSSQNPGSKIQTPNIDQLAREGMRFTDAHAPASLCTPTRYGLLTGRYAWRGRLKQGVSRQYDPPLIEEGRLTVGKILQENRYKTACIGKWHLGWDWPLKDGGFLREKKDVEKADAVERLELEKSIDFSKPLSNGPTTKGFDIYFGDDVPNYPPYAYFENDRLTAFPSTMKPVSMYGHPGRMVPGWSLEAVMPDITQKAVGFIREMGKKKQPFFLYFALTSPHVPIAPSDAFKGKSAAGGYGDFIVETDWAVGEVVKALEEAGVANETIIIFTSDNGSPGQDGTNMSGTMNGILKLGHNPNYPFRGMKTDLWEGGHRVPFIVKWPARINMNTICDMTICHTDLMATMGEILNYKIPSDAGEDSYSLMPLLIGKKQNKYKRPYTIHHSSEGQFAIREGDWKLILTGGSGGGLIQYPADSLQGKPVEMQLYNLAKDPGEQENLIYTFPEKGKALLELLETARAFSHTKTK